MSDPSPAAAPAVELPSWVVASDRRRAHIARVVALIKSWGEALNVSADERKAWHDAASWHDALRDAPEEMLRDLSGDTTSEASLLHGPATAARLAADGERRQDVLDAIRWHTVGHTGWSRTGRALYMADFLEPGRPFARRDRAYLARMVAYDFDGTFREVVAMRMAWTLWEGKAMGAETAALWSSVR
jgi:HD superfamily phosphohydrolase YqeK